MLRDDCISNITEDLTWRIKEIHDLMHLSSQNNKAYEKVVLRSLIPISYAHWEGHVIYASDMYIKYISKKKLVYGKLMRNFQLNEFFSYRVRRGENKPYQDHLDFLDRVLSVPTKQFKRIDENILTSRSNLNSKILKDICSFLNLEITLFEPYFTFIDTILLDKRNNIAHGRLVPIDDKPVKDIAEKTIELMRTFSNLIENHIHQESYKILSSENECSPSSD